MVYVLTTHLLFRDFVCLGIPGSGMVHGPKLPSRVLIKGGTITWRMIPYVNAECSMVALTNLAFVKKVAVFFVGIPGNGMERTGNKYRVKTTLTVVLGRLAGSIPTERFVAALDDARCSPT